MDISTKEINRLKAAVETQRLTLAKTESQLVATELARKAYYERMADWGYTEQDPSNVVDRMSAVLSRSLGKAFRRPQVFSLSAQESAQ